MIVTFVSVMFPSYVVSMYNVDCHLFVLRLVLCVQILVVMMIVFVCSLTCPSCVVSR